MAKTGPKRKSRYFRLKALNDLSQEFADAMCKADMGYISRMGAFTGRMSQIWAKYRELATEYDIHG